MTYFAFTTLSTVGFGDYHPRSDVERFFCAFILLFGVACFSLIMGTFTEILDEFQNYNKDINHGEELRRFFGVLQKFNNNEAMDLQLRRKIEAFFEYKWVKDKNLLLETNDGVKMFNELPKDTQIYIYRNYLFCEFLNNFRKFFSIKNPASQHQPSFFTWES